MAAGDPLNACDGGLIASLVDAVGLEPSVPDARAARPALPPGPDRKRRGSRASAARGLNLPARPCETRMAAVLIVGGYRRSAGWLEAGAGPASIFFIAELLRERRRQLRAGRNEVSAYPSPAPPPRRGSDGCRRSCSPNWRLLRRPKRQISALRRETGDAAGNSIATAWWQDGVVPSMAWRR